MKEDEGWKKKIKRDMNWYQPQISKNRKFQLQKVKNFEVNVEENVEAYVEAYVEVYI